MYHRAGYGYSTNPYLPPLREYIALPDRIVTEQRLGSASDPIGHSLGPEAAHVLQARAPHGEIADEVPYQRHQLAHGGGKCEQATS